MIVPHSRKLRCSYDRANGLLYVIDFIIEEPYAQARRGGCRCGLVGTKANNSGCRGLYEQIETSVGKAICSEGPKGYEQARCEDDRYIIAKEAHHP